MADIDLIQEEIKQDEVSVDIPIFQKNNEPYIGPDGKQCTIAVLGTDAELVRNAKALTQRRFLRGAQRLEPEDVARNRVNQALAAITGFSGWERAGQPLAFTPENARLLLSADHILEQVEAGIKNHASFFKTSSPS